MLPFAIILTFIAFASAIAVSVYPGAESIGNLIVWGVLALVAWGVTYHDRQK